MRRRWRVCPGACLAVLPGVLLGERCRLIATLVPGVLLACATYEPSPLHESSEPAAAAGVVGMASAGRPPSISAFGGSGGRPSTTPPAGGAAGSSSLPTAGSQSTETAGSAGA